MKYNNKITQEELKSLLDYNSDTGIFTWKVQNGPRARVGYPAGTTDGYVRIKINGILYLAHRLAFLYETGVWPKDQIDHINHIRSDNRFSNIREVTHSENKRNVPIRSDNTSGVTGVFWDKSINKWVSQIMFDNKSVYLGSFNTISEAMKARSDAEIKYGFHENHGNKRNYGY